MFNFQRISTLGHLKFKSCTGQVIIVFVSVCILVNSATSQQLLNSLAVLFRARPPWPTIYPTPKAFSRFDGTGTRNAIGGFGKVLIPNPFPGANNVGPNSAKTGSRIQFAQTISNSWTPLIKQNGHPSPQSFSFPASTTTMLPTTTAELTQKYHGNVHGAAIDQEVPSQLEQPSNAVPTISLTFPGSTSNNIPQIVSPIQSQFGGTKTQSISDPIQALPAQTSWQWKQSALPGGLQQNKAKSQDSRSRDSIPMSDLPKHINPKALDFRPSPLLYETYDGSSAPNSISATSFRFTDAKDPPRYESGFKPISYHQYASHFGTTASHETYRNSFTQWNAHMSTTTTQEPVRVQFPSNTQEPVRAQFPSNTQDPDRVQFPSKSDSLESLEAKPRDGREGFSLDDSFSATSSDRIEDWVKPKKKLVKVDYSFANSGSHEDKGNGGNLSHGKHKFPVYSQRKEKPTMRVRPSKCDNFHRYGFCPITQHYPTAQIEKIVTRCAALLSHLIAPLPKSDTRYDILVTRNDSNGHRIQKQKLSTSKVWKWKDYKGSPLCDTEEVKITPGWAKNDEGEWLIVLQTEIWKQEAQISVCSIAHDGDDSCTGNTCHKRYLKEMGMKCVQRFTAQRLAVLNPDNQDRCPVIRSVFLPSACVCVSEPIPQETSIEMRDADVPAVSTSSVEVTDDSDKGQGNFPDEVMLTSHQSQTPILIQNGTFKTTLVVTENSLHTQ